MFNYENYLNNYPDLLSSGIDTHQKALEHYIEHGIREGRTDKNNDDILMEYFDYKEYLNRYPDLLSSGVNTHQKALEHYKNIGIREGRVCNLLNFEWKQYCIILVFRNFHR